MEKVQWPSGFKTTFEKFKFLKDGLFMRILNEIQKKINGMKRILLNYLSDK